MDATSWRLMESSWVFNSASTHQRQRTTFSLLDASVVSSTIMVQNLDDLTENATLRKMWSAITFMISFCMSADVYLSVFLFIHVTSLWSSSARSFSSCVKLELESSPCPRRGRPCRARNWILDMIFRRHCRRSNFSRWCCTERLSATSNIVAGMVTTFRMASLWHLLA